MTDSLIQKLEAVKHPFVGETEEDWNDALDIAIDIIRQHEAEPAAYTAARKEMLEGWPDA